MPRRRNQLKSYNISKHRYMELYHYCMQYNEWMEFLKSTEGLNSHNDTEGRSGQNTSMVENIAIKRMEMIQRCSLIRDTAAEANESIQGYIFEAVTNEGYTYNYLHNRGMPCGRKMFYEARRKFYYLLSTKLK